MEATDFAVWMVSRCGTRQMPLAILSVLVTAAAAPITTKGSMTS